MTGYRRAHVPGACWFFTVNLAQRSGNSLLVDRIDVLRAAFGSVRERHPFHMDAVVILPEHLHCIMTLPEGDTDYSTRWNLIKGGFSRAIETGERISQSRTKRGERGIWQRRFWEHLIATRRISIATRIHPLESGQAWLGAPCRRLAAFKFSQLRASWDLSGGLVWRGWRDGGWRVARTMRFLCHRILQNLAKPSCRR